MAPRFSIVPGEFVDDPRPTLVHYRVLLALGRRTNRAGWCMVSQTKLAGHLGFNRQTVNGAISELVKWGYVERHGQQQTHRAICRYRVLLDRPESDEDIDDGVLDDPVASHAVDATLNDNGGDVSSTGDTWVSSQGDTYVSSTGDTRVASQATRGVASQATPQRTWKNDPPKDNAPPPTPARRGRERARDKQLEVEQTIAAIRTPGRERLVDGLFGPLLRRRTFAAPDVAFALGQLCDWPKLARLDDQALGEVLDTLIAERASVVKDHDVQAAVERALPASDERRRAAEAAEANRAASPELRALWAEMLAWMRGLHGEAVVRSWLEPLRLVGTEPGPRGSQRLVLEARSPVLADMVARTYAAHVEQAARACGAGEVQVEIRRPANVRAAA